MENGNREPIRSDAYRVETSELVRSFTNETQYAVNAWIDRSERHIDPLPFLAVGSCLREFGYEIAVDSGASGSPLWRVARRGAVPSFFVDVVSIDLTSDELTEFRVSSHLVETLQLIPVNQRLHMSVTDYRQFVDEDTREQIMAKTRGWLDTPPPSIGDQMDLTGVVLTVMPWDKPRDHLAVMGPAFSYWIRKLRIDSLLEERVRLHHEIAAKHPYVLAAVAPERVGLSRRCYSELLTDRPDEPKRAEASPASDIDRLPLFAAHSEISAATWVWKSSRGIWEMKAIHNRTALRRLPSDSLDG
ncbi:hypothetical protein ACFLSG_03995 [Candidatus Bipolaricaulota bacterium]